jgi:DNA helicase HerA-like ATPase
MQRKAILDVGQSGTGKTRVARMLAERFPRRFILDPLGEYSGTVFESMTDVFDFFEQNADLEEFSIVLRSSDESDADFLFRLAWSVGNLLLVVEEANIYMDSRAKFPSFLQLVSRGRHRGVHLLCVSQRVPEVMIAFRAQKTSLITFLQDEPSDIDHLEEWGFDAENIQSLERFDERFDIPVEGQHYLIIGEKLDEIHP